jgi:hypothetical protein
VALLVLAAVAAVAVWLPWLLLDPRARQLAFGAASVHDTSAEGLSLARAYLRARGSSPHVGTLTHPIGLLPLEDDAVVLRIAPRPSMQLWLRRASREETVPRRKAGEEAGNGEADRDRERDPEREAWRRLQRDLRRAVGGRDDDGSEDEAWDEGEEPDDDVPADGSREDEAGSADGPGESAASDDGTPPWERLREGLKWAMFPGVPLLDDDERVFVLGGGRIVLALDLGWGDVSPREVDRHVPVEKAHPAWPGVDRLQPDPLRVLRGRGLVASHAIFVAGASPVVSRMPYGRGDVVLLACPEVLRNDRLDLADHLALLEALAGRGRAVYFDELVHGAPWQPGLLQLVLAWGLGPSVLLLGLAAAAAAWRGRTRLGPPADLHAATRSEAVDLVESVGALYRRTLRRSEAIGLYHRHLVRQVARTEGVHGEALEARLRRLTGSRHGAEPLPAGGEADLSSAELRRRLAVLNHAFEELTRERRA